jgi:hypothetical protein
MLHKVFAVISVDHLLAMGLSVFQNDQPFRGHALIRPTADMDAAAFGTAFLRIPSVWIDILSTKGCRELDWVTLDKDDINQSMAFHGITGNIM